MIIIMVLFAITWQFVNQVTSHQPAEFSSNQSHPIKPEYGDYVEIQSKQDGLCKGNILYCYRYLDCYECTIKAKCSSEEKINFKTWYNVYNTPKCSVVDQNWIKKHNTSY